MALGERYEAQVIGGKYMDEPRPWPNASRPLTALLFVERHNVIAFTGLQAPNGPHDSQHHFCSNRCSLIHSKIAALRHLTLLKVLPRNYGLTQNPPLHAAVVQARIAARQTRGLASGHGKGPCRRRRCEVRTLLHSHLRLRDPMPVANTRI